ncbi:MAG: tRNA (N(6)-L-threonylcarbamoyladenosine(37)-C(2))-methylthiotransferase MtaB [Armatimonadota bacterium]
MGCKVNQYESARIAEELWERGFDIAEGDEPLDVCVVNTCSVTQVAAAKSRNAIRRIRRRCPRALIVVTGCGTEADRSAVESVPEIDLVVANREKDRIADYILERFAGQRGILLPHPRLGEGFLYNNGRVRALLKVQDGCDNFCSYCIIPYTRGKPRSRPAQDVLEEAKRLAEAGYREVVVTGICIGTYNSGGRRLTDLLKQLARIEGIERIRLSSIEPGDVDEALVELLRTEPRVCRHLHLPLQSGDDDILRAMNRPYTAAEYIRILDCVRSAVPELAVTTDVIVGFPGETEEQFRRTMELVESLRFAKVHVFPFSPRQGTPAAEMPNQVPQKEKDRRVHELISVSQRLQRDFAEGYVGRQVDVLVEGARPKDGWAEGLTDTYLRVCFPCSESLEGQVVKVRVVGANSSGAEGEMV